MGWISVPFVGFLFVSIRAFKQSQFKFQTQHSCYRFVNIFGIDSSVKERGLKQFVMFISRLENYIQAVIDGISS
ncbi:hypothetical protein D3C86_1508660 [compost metagenome]